MTKGGRVTSRRRVDKDDERQSKLRLRATWPSASHRGFSLLWVWGLVFSVLGFFFFWLINKSVLQYWVMGFGLLLLCMDCIWFSLPTTWLWIDFWFALYWFFFFSFFFLGENPWVCYLRIMLGLACYGQWAWLCYQNFFFFLDFSSNFFFGFFFFFGLESRTDNFFFFLIRGCS